MTTENTENKSQENFDPTICPYCNGTGERRGFCCSNEEHWKHKKCKHCDGSGKIPEVFFCPSCGSMFSFMYAVIDRDSFEFMNYTGGSIKTNLYIIWCYNCGYLEMENDLNDWTIVGVPLGEGEMIDIVKVKDDLIPVNQEDEAGSEATQESGGENNKEETQESGGE